MKSKFIMAACFKCGYISKFIDDSKAYEDFFTEHFECEGRFTSWYPDREEGRRHAILAGIPYGLADGTKVSLNE